MLEDIKTRFLFVSPVSARHRSPRRRSSTRPPPDNQQEEDEDEDMTFASVATNVKYPVRIDDRYGQNEGNGVATLIIPGWVRERAAEALFEGDEDEASVAGCILDVLVKVRTKFTDRLYCLRFLFWLGLCGLLYQFGLMLPLRSLSDAPHSFNQISVAP